MNAHTVGPVRSDHLAEAWNVGVAALESAGFGLGIWVALTVLTPSGAASVFTPTGGTEAPVLAGALFLVGRLWVGSEALSRPWLPRVPEAIVLALLIGLSGRAAGWAYEVVAPYVPVPDAMALGLLRGAWRAAALVAPYAFAPDRPRTAPP